MFYYYLNMEHCIIYDDDFMLSRLIASIDRKDSMKISVVPPKIQKKDRKTYIFNFTQFCVSIRREREHVKLYLESELSVKSSITEAGMLIIEKIFEPTRITKIMEQYINEFVLCKESRCRSLCTKFIREDKINYLMCEVCNSRFAIKLKFGN